MAPHHTILADRAKQRTLLDAGCRRPCVNPVLHPPGNWNGTNVPRLANQVDYSPVPLAFLNPLVCQADHFGAAQSAPQQQRQHGGVPLPAKELRRNGPEEALALLKAEPIANLLTNLPNTFHATNPGDGIRAENTA